jgi:DNA polymerase/3'-5' exonuclease PolX
LSFKRDIPLKQAEEIALDFQSKTRELYRRCLLAGSIRRKESVVHDIDFAVIPRGKAFGVWKDRVSHRVEEIGGQVITFGETISNFRYRGVQVNLFLCMDEDAWGVTQMWATGPKGHTIGMTYKARAKGLVINSRGLWTQDQPPKLVKARTEEEVGKLLGWKYKPPESRGKTEKPAKKFAF